MFQAVADALGLGEMSAAIRAVMFEKARTLGLDKPAKRKKG